MEGCDGTGWVTAGKPLARKRPQLIPVYDEVVRCAFGTSNGFWRWLDGKLREDGGTLTQHLAALRTEASIPDQISALRILDVVIWMRHRLTHTGYHCPGPHLGAL